MNDRVRVEVRGELAVVSLNRPDRHNGMDLAMLKTPDGFFLAWTENHHDEDFPQHLAPGGVDASSPAEKVREALHLKV